MIQNKGTMDMGELCPERVHTDSLDVPQAELAQKENLQVQQRAQPADYVEEGAKQMPQHGEHKGLAAQPKKKPATASTSQLSSNTAYLVKQVLMQTLPKEPALESRPPSSHPEGAALPPSVRDFFDLSATIFNSRAPSPQQAIDKASALDLLARAYAKHKYVVDTIEKAKAKHQQNGAGELPDFTQEEIIDQMIKLAEIEIAKDAKRRRKAAKMAQKEAAGKGWERTAQLGTRPAADLDHQRVPPAKSHKIVDHSRKPARQNSCSGQIQQTVGPLPILERPCKAEALNSTVADGSMMMQLQMPATANQSGFIDERMLDISDRQSSMSTLTAQVNPISKRTQPLRLKSNRSARSLRGPAAGTVLAGPVNFMSKLQNHVHKNVFSANENSRSRPAAVKTEFSGFDTNITSPCGGTAVNGVQEKQKVPPRPPKHHDETSKKSRERCGNQTVVIDENTDFLIKNLNNQNFWTTTNQNQAANVGTSGDEATLLSTFDIRPAAALPTAPKGPSSTREKLFSPWQWDETDMPPGRALTTYPEKPEGNALPEDNFKLLLKYMKSWKQYTKIARENRRVAAQEMDQRIKALAHHETRLVVKSFRSLKDYREDRERKRQCTKIVRYQVNQNIKKFFFETMRRKFIRTQRRKYLKKVAKKFHLEQRKCKCFKNWQRISRKLNNESEEIFQKIVQSNPYAAEIMLEHIAYNFYLGRGGQGEGAADCGDPFITDIVKFHFFALKHFTLSKGQSSQQHVRIRRPLASRFSAAVEHVLRQKQYRVLRCLTRNRDSMQCFRRMKLFRFKQRCLGALSRAVVDKRKLRFLRYKVSRRLMSTSLDALIGYWQGRKRLRNRFEELRNARVRRVQARFLLEWRELWAYYSKFTQSTYCYSADKKSRQMFLVKPFGMLKGYWRMRKTHRQNILLADSKLYDRYTRICFQNWAWYCLRFQRNARFARAQITKKQTFKFKREHFDAFKRTYRNSTTCREFATARLKRRVIQSLKHRRQFLQLKETITQICVDKYVTNVRRKSFDALRSYASQKVQLKQLEKVLAQKRGHTTREKVILALQLNVERGYQKKMDTNFLKKMHQANQQRRILLGMSSHAKLRKDLRVRAKALQLQQQHLMVRRHFEQMYLRYCKKNSDRRISANMRKRIDLKITREKFQFWLRRYSTLKESEEILTARVRKQVSSDTFKLWRMRMFQSKDFKFKNRCFLERQRARQLQTYWTAFSETIFTQKREGERNEAAKWFFWKSKSSTVLRQLYVHSQWRKKKREATDARRRLTLQRAFRAIRRKYELKAALRRALGIKKVDILTEIFFILKGYSHKKRSCRDLEDDFRKARQAQRLRALFEVLRHPRLYQHRDLQSLEVHELFKLTSVFLAWKTRTTRAKALHRKQGEVQQARRAQLLRAHLYCWKYQLYLRGQEQQVVRPRHEERLAKLTHGVFFALRRYATLQKQQRFAKETAHNYYRESLLTKSLESMRWNSNQNVHHRNLIEYMSLARNKILVRGCFDRLLESHLIRKELAAKAKALKQKSEAMRCFTLFEHWLKLTQQKQIIDKDLDQIAVLYERQLKVKIFQALYEYRTTNIVKTALAKKASSHQNHRIIRKTYEALAWYGLVHMKKKDNLKTQAELWRKRKILGLWYQVLLKTLGNDGLTVCEVAMSRSASVDLGHLGPTGGPAPESAPRALTVPMSQDDPAQGRSAKEPSSPQRKGQGPTSFGHDQDGHSRGKSHRGPMSETVRSLDMPLQLQAFRSKRSPAAIGSGGSDNFDLSDLNTSEELRMAHDNMSYKLQELLQLSQRADEGTDQDDVQKEIAVLKELISLIKNKYQLARQNEEAGVEDGAVESEISRDHPGPEDAKERTDLVDDGQEVPQDIPSDVSMGQDETLQSQGAEETIFEERAAEYHVSRVKLKVLASIKLFNQQESGAYSFYPKLLVQRALNALKVGQRPEDCGDPDALLEGAVNQRKRVKILQSLKHNAIEGQNKSELAIQHYRCRQVRVVLFALKKHQLVTIMQKTIVQGRLDRLKERIFWEWRVAYARAIKQREERVVTQAATPQMGSLQAETNVDGTDSKAYNQAEAIFQAYLHGAASEDKMDSGEHMKQATSQFGSSLQNEFNFDKNLDDILDCEAAAHEGDRDREEGDDMHDIQQFQDFRNISAINPAGNETLAGTKQSFVGLATLAHGLSGELISEVDLASGLPKLEDFKGEEEEIEQMQAEIDGSEREDFQTAPRQGGGNSLKMTGNFDLQGFEEECMGTYSVEKEVPGEKASINDSRPRRESEARSEIRSVIGAAHGDELGFDADPQPFHGFNDDSDDNDDDSLDEFTRQDVKETSNRTREQNQRACEDLDTVLTAGGKRGGSQTKMIVPPLQQISEARSLEEATPGLGFNKYKQAKFQTRQPQTSPARGSEPPSNDKQLRQNNQAASRQSLEDRPHPATTTHESNDGMNEESDY